jgi:hypothetical protein
MSLRPLGLGELVDHAVASWRAHWKALFALCLPFQVLGYIAVKTGLSIGRLAFPLVRGDAAALELIKANPLQGALQLAAFMALLGAGFVLALLVGQVAGVAMTRYLYPHVVELDSTTRALSTRFALSQVPAVAGSLGLSLGWSAMVGLGVLAPSAGLLVAGGLLVSNRPALGGVLLVCGLVTAAVATLGLLVWFVLRFLLISPIIAVEGASALVAFRRAGTMSSGRVAPGPVGWVKGRLTVLITIIGAVLLLLSAVNSLPTLLVGAVYGAGLRTPIDEVVPAVVLVPIELLQVVVGALFAPLYEALKVWFYVDMRVRREGLDLELALGQVTPR